MTASWDDLNARAQGLSGRLLGARAIEALAAGATLDGLALRLEGAGFGPLKVPANAASLEGAVRRSAADRLRILSRWCGDRTGVLAVLFEDEDRRSLRALLRGAAAGAPPEERLSGLVPTPELPPRALEELAMLDEVADLAVTLAAWGNPYADALRVEPHLPRNDLPRMEAALAGIFAGRARKGARRGDRALRSFVGETIDVENALAAIVLATGAAEEDPERYFVEGGGALPFPVFVEAARAPDRAAAAHAIAAALHATPLAGALAGPPAGTERRLLAARVKAQTRLARLEPLSSRPLLSYALRLRAETLDLASLIWATALGAPARAVPFASLP